MVECMLQYECKNSVRLVSQVSVSDSFFGTEIDEHLSVSKLYQKRAESKR